ncbi:MAG: 30S ribosomal protein S12 methylthiotransferase RimO [Gammaproteobacteria bacterium]|nr:30S ribosomal protein S12 methylthiotransferase RimO [Gammaproteobacteria bacterium]
MTESAAKVGFISLGCPKALVDSERILTRLRQDGYTIVNTYTDADVVVVNTCGFIDSAKAESLETIGEALAENGRVIVTGCLGVQAEEIRSRYPQILTVTGPQQYAEVVDAVHQHLPPIKNHDPFVDLVPPQGIKLTPAHYSYLKISEGCNHHCSFCIIPSMRGRLVSRSIDDVMGEAEGLVQAGVKELLVIAQDTSAYGSDIRYQTGFWQGRPVKADLLGLCTALASLGVWVRLHYVYPYPHVDKIIPLMAEGKLLPYLDAPFQHGSPRVLKQMRRPAAAEDTLARIAAWRAICPELTIRSTFIVGFPGETEADFDTLLGFLQVAQLDRVGCFQYSPVAGAAANDLPGTVPAEIKEQRWHRFMQIQAGISAAKLQHKVGRTLPVIIDKVNGTEYIGRSHADAPEIDGLVYLKSRRVLQPGGIVNVKISRAGDYDLWGKTVR